MKNKFPLFGPNSTGREPLRGAPKMNTWGTPKSDPLSPVVPVSPEMFEKARWGHEFPVPVASPLHLQAPEGARTLDLRRAISVPAATVDATLMSFQCLAGATTVIYFYSLVYPSAPGTVTPALEWIPTIDGQRVLQYHGSPGVSESPNPTTNLNAATAFDFTSSGLVRCQLLMQPGQTLRWGVSNATGVAQVMGVRMTGYVDFTQQLQSKKFGD